MRKFCVPILVVAAHALVSFACGSATTPTTATLQATMLQHEMKGWELYSWPATPTQWNFALMAGTDRPKTIEEITTGPDATTSGVLVKLTAHSTDELLVLLDRLPAGESVSWIGPAMRGQWSGAAGPLAMPPQAVIDQVKAKCAALGLQLHVGS